MLREEPRLQRPAAGRPTIAAAASTGQGLPAEAAAAARAKLCIYGIALNERKYVERFMAASKGADLVLIADTGSWDGTPEALEAAGAVVHRVTLRPFRFDTARNIALSLLPPDCDLCLALDLADEVQPGWAEALQAEWARTGGSLAEVRVAYVWRQAAGGPPPPAPVLAAKVHSRSGYAWDGPAHETLRWVGQVDSGSKPPAPAVLPGVLVHNTEQAECHGACRMPFLHLLKLGVEEEPDDPRRAYLYGRELHLVGWLDDAIAELKRYLRLPSATNQGQRASALRYISRCQLELGQPQEAQAAALQALAEYTLAGSSGGTADNTRAAADNGGEAAAEEGGHMQPWEPWMALAQASHRLEDWPVLYWAATRALAAANRSAPPLGGAGALGVEPHDLAALSAHYMGLHQVAVVQGEAALALKPHDERLQSNMRFYREAVAGPGRASGNAPPHEASLPHS
ncbi:hypothetical protein ABPG75_013056 [Micractinium tetrahymenae]